ncbi:MAG: dTDP-4-dehydrorhamnose reductase [Bacteroidales bacterium]|nr:dTDP-4-dehydrorhamnose reductase [Bacteroidales bacterium]
MKILITGAKGQLGRSIHKHAPLFTSLDITYTDVEDLDITDMPALEKYLSAGNYDYVVNCAAYTAVDKAEEDDVKAFLINTKAVENLSVLSKNLNFGLIHISTDFIFDGFHYKPYVESDKPGPRSIYATTKARAEEVMLANALNGLIIRTSWLYSEFGHNFVKTIIRYATERDSLNIVCDQTGTPTYAGDLAETLLIILSNKKIPEGVHIYHYSNEGTASWFDFAKAIVSLSEIDCTIEPIPTEAYPLPAKRPYYSVLNTSKIKNDFGISIPYWRDSLAACLKLLPKETEGFS